MQTLIFQSAWWSSLSKMVIKLEKKKIIIFFFL